MEMIEVMVDIEVVLVVSEATTALRNYIELFVMNVVRIVKYLLDQQVQSQFCVVVVLKLRTVRDLRGEVDQMTTLECVGLIEVEAR